MRSAGFRVLSMNEKAFQLNPANGPYAVGPEVTIYHGDCRAILRGVASESVDMVLTDPPYCVGHRGRWGSDQEPIQGDEDARWIAPAFEEIWRVLKQDSFCLSFYGWPHADVFLSDWKAVGFRPGEPLGVRQKQNRPRAFQSGATRACLSSRKGRAPPIGYRKERRLFVVSRGLDAPPKSKTSVHDLPNDSRLYGRASAGSRSVHGQRHDITRCSQFGKASIGIEIEERYCKLAVERLSQSRLDFETPPPSNPATNGRLFDFPEESQP